MALKFTSMNQNGYEEGMDITVHTGDNENTSYHNVEIIVFMKATLMLYRNCETASKPRHRYLMITYLSDDKMQ